MGKTHIQYTKKSMNNMLKYSYLRSTIITLNMELLSLFSRNDILGKMNLILV